MDKLIELLNEYDKPLGWYYEDWVLDCKLNLYEYMAYEWICSARYWFIKWLVENDKIDRDKKEIEKSDYDITFTWALTMDKKSDLDIMVDTLLMLLSISDTPIDDLISYLK